MSRFRIDILDAPLDVPRWAAVNPTPILSSDVTKDRRTEVERAVAEVLQCDHVLVLSGLGTSLCIKGTDGGTSSLFPTMGGLWDKVQEKIEDHLFKKVQESVGFTKGKNIEELLSRCQMKLSLEPSAPADFPTPNLEPTEAEKPNITEFVKEAEEVIRNECRKDLDSNATLVHEDFLRRLVRRGPRRPRTNLFTTNYDLCFETAAARISLPVIDGFSFSVPQRFQPEVFDYDIVTSSSYSKEPDFIPRLLRLFKLHGSVDWHHEKQENVIIKKPDTEAPILIYPQSGKYAASYTPPFLEIMSRFQGLLRQRNVGVLVICCGLNDLHIAEPLLSAVKSNSSLRMVICAPDLCEEDVKNLNGDGSAKATTVTNAVIQQFDHLIENGDARLTLINGFFPDLVRLMPMHVTQTDGEQHESRIRKLETNVAALKARSGKNE